jgi:cell wall-associated NlpC family hydrolase
VLPSAMLDACVSSGRYFVGRLCLSRTIARCPSVMQLADAPISMPAITSSSWGEQAARAAIAPGVKLLGGERGDLEPLGRSPYPRKPSIDPLALIAWRRRRVMSAAGRLRAPARVLLVLAVFVGASLGLVRPTPSRAAVAATSSKQLRLRAWRYAMHQHGKPYVWGGTGPYGFDCSGLVYASYRSEGLTLPRTTYEMLHSKQLIRIRKSQASRGDLAFFGSGHVELYDHGKWTYGAAAEGTRIGFHRMNSYWHPTMYFRVRR